MAVASTGNISIKTAAGSGRSIDTDGRTDISSGSLVTLSTGDVVTAGNTIDGSAPHGMLEFRGYQHIQSMSGIGISFVGRPASSGAHMARINTADNFGMGMSVIITGFEYQFAHIYNFFTSTYSIFCYIRREIGGVNNSSYSQYFNSSNNLSLLSNSSWTLFATITVADNSLSGGWDSMTLNISHSDSSSGSGGLGMIGSQVDGSYSYNLNPAGTAESIPYRTYRAYGYGHRLTTTAECSSYYPERTSTVSLSLNKSGYTSFTTPTWTTVHDHDHIQAGAC